MIKRLNLFLVCLCLIINSCKNSSQKRIGFLVPNLEYKRFPKEINYFSTKVKQLGYDVITANGNFDGNLQTKQAIDLIKEGVSVLVICPVNSNTAAEIVRIAHENDVKVISYERMINNCNLDYFVSFNNTMVGVIMANYVINKKPEGNYILLYGDKIDNNAILVKKGWEKVISNSIRSNKIHIIFQTYVEEWSGDEAYAIMHKVLNLSDTYPDVVLSAYDGMSEGVIKALDEKNISDVLVTGQDAELEACRNVAKSKQTMTVYKPLKKLAELAAEIAVKCANNEKLEVTNQSINNKLIDVPSYLVEPVMVDRDNLKSTVIADGFYTEAEIYNNQ